MVFTLLTLRNLSRKNKSIRFPAGTIAPLSLLIPSSFNQTHDAGRKNHL
jgi:hypothetical protein